MNKYLKTAVKIAAIYALVRRSGVIGDVKELKDEAKPFLDQALSAAKGIV